MYLTDINKDEPTDRYDMEICSDIDNRLQEYSMEFLQHRVLYTSRNLWVFVEILYILYYEYSFLW
jgi:hypothetical protein